MQLNIRKLDERIQKLQEIRRIAADPEMVSLLLEFIAGDEDRTQAAPAAPLPVTHAPAAAQFDDLDIVNQVMKGIDGPGNGARAGKRA